MKIKKLLIIGITALLSMTAISSSALAAYNSDSNTRAAVFVIGTDIGPQPFAVSHTYGYSETYTPGGSYVRYTHHQTYSYVQGWTGSAFGSVINSNCR